MFNVSHPPPRVDGNPCASPVPGERDTDAWLRTQCSWCAAPATNPNHQGTVAECDRCVQLRRAGVGVWDLVDLRRAELSSDTGQAGFDGLDVDPPGWPAWTDSPARSLLDPADDVAGPTPADWEAYAEVLDAEDLDWWAAQDAEHHTLEPTPLEVLAEAAPFDFDAPNPASEVDWDVLYADRVAADHPPTLDVGHPAHVDR